MKLFHECEKIAIKFEKSLKITKNWLNLTKYSKKRMTKCLFINDVYYAKC